MKEYHGAPVAIVESGRIYLKTPFDSLALAPENKTQLGAIEKGLAANFRVIQTGSRLVLRCGCCLGLGEVVGEFSAEYCPYCHGEGVETDGQSRPIYKRVLEIVSYSLHDFGEGRRVYCEVMVA